MIDDPAGTTATGLPAESFLALSDEQVTAAALLHEIRQRLAQRYPAGDWPTTIFPEYSIAGDPPEFPADIPYSFSLYYHLQRAHELYADAETTPVLAPSPATRIPIIGRMWAQVRHEAHNLILFYVNRHLAHETATNRHLIAAVSELTRQVEDQQRMIIQLEARLSELEPGPPAE